jgi:uncharacterized protein YecT (DUF1311 family)
MKSIFSVAMLALTFTQASAASFDCAKANSPSAKQICSDPELSKLDDELAVVFSEARSKLSIESQKLLIEGQRSWLRFHSRLCFFDDEAKPKDKKASVACQIDEYRSRIEALKKTGSLVLGVKTIPYFQGWFEANTKERYVIHESRAVVVFDGTSPTSLALNAIIQPMLKAVLFESNGKATGNENAYWSASVSAADGGPDIAIIKLFSEGYTGGAHGESDSGVVYFSKMLNRQIRLSDVFKSTEWKLQAEKAARQHFAGKGVEAVSYEILAKQEDGFRYIIDSDGFLIDGFLSSAERAADGVTMRWKDFSKYLTPLGIQLSRTKTR